MLIISIVHLHMIILVLRVSREYNTLAESYMFNVLHYKGDIASEENKFK